MDYRGTVVVNYRLTEKLGEGGFGVVYLAEHEQLGRKAAVKILHPEYARRQELVERFFREAKAVCAISHRSIIDVHNFGTLETGEPYYLMEYLKGENLTQLVTRLGALSPAMVAAIFAPVAAALTAAHQSGVIHRDLKPDNIMVLVENDRIVDVKLLDFGIAKLLDPSVAAHSQTGFTMGTPAFMAPEQSRDAKNVDVRADVYSFGATVYMTLAGRPPFIADNITDLILAVHSTTPPALSLYAPNVGQATEDAVAQCLAKERDDRPPTIDAAWQNIATSLQRAEHTEPPSGTAPTAMAKNSEAAAADPFAGADHRFAPTVAKPHTTLGSSAVQVPTTRSPSSSKRGGPVLASVGAAVLLLGGAGVFVALSGDDSHEPQQVAAAAQSDATATASDSATTGSLAQRTEPYIELEVVPVTDDKPKEPKKPEKPSAEPPSRRVLAKRAMESGRKSALAGKFRNAEHAYSQAIAITGSVEAYIGRAHAKSRQGNRTGACSDLARAAKKRPSAKLSRRIDKAKLIAGCTVSKPPDANLPERPSRIDLSNTLKRATGRMRRCATSDKASGVLRLDIAIAPTGKASSVGAASGTSRSLVVGDTRNCVFRVVRSLRFPASRLGVNIVYPVRINP